MKQRLFHFSLSFSLFSFIKHFNYLPHIFCLLFKAFVIEGFFLINALEKGKENNKNPHLNIATFSYILLGLKDGGFMKS